MAKKVAAKKFVVPKRKQLSILSLEEMNFSNWEPLMNFRFIVRYDHIPSHMISDIRLPTAHNPRQIQLERYVAVTDDMAVMLNPKFPDTDITIDFLGPVGDMVSSVIYSKCALLFTSCTPLSWASDEPIKITYIFSI